MTKIIYLLVHTTHETVGPDKNAIAYEDKDMAQWAMKQRAKEIKKENNENPTAKTDLSIRWGNPKTGYFEAIEIFPIYYIKEKLTEKK